VLKLGYQLPEPPRSRRDLVRQRVAQLTNVVTMPDMAQEEEEEEEDYKLWPANKSDRSWQSLSNPAKRHSFMSN